MPYNSTNIPAEVIAALPATLQAQVPLYDETLQANLYASAGICIGVAFLAVFLRLYARFLLRQPIGWDDYIIMVGLLFTAAFVGICFAWIALGGGRHQVVIYLEHPENIVPFFKLKLAAGAIYSPALFFIKVSILLLYHRIFPSKRLKRVCIAVGIFVLCYSVTTVFTNIFQCTPVDSNWDMSVEAHCVDLNTALVVLSSINVLTDIIILVLPMPLIWRLKITTRRKMQLSCIFLLGVFVTIVSMVRVVYVETLSFTDVAWLNSYAAMWSVVETCVAIVVACLPVMRPVFNQLVFGSPAGPGNKRSTDGSGGRFGAPNDRHIVTIGGGGGGSHPYPLNVLPGINVTRTAEVTTSGKYAEPNGSYAKLVDGREV